MRVDVTFTIFSPFSFVTLSTNTHQHRWLLSDSEKNEPESTRDKNQFSNELISKLSRPWTC